MGDVVPYNPYRKPEVSGLPTPLIALQSKGKGHCFFALLNESNALFLFLSVPCHAVIHDDI